MRYPFVDEVCITVRSGDGGKGCVSFRREKCVELGGPNGGCGGRGGDVVAAVDPQLATLLDYRFIPRQFAGHGGQGMGSQCTGRDGAVRLLRVPPGTIISHAETGEILCDLKEAGQRFVLAVGGRGGKGNEHFKTSVRQAPQFAQPGEPGLQMQVRLELKMLADVGLVGMPNVGKSSLIARLSAARPKVANYPFTTLVPNLGVVQFGQSQHFVVADVPGLVVGAHTGTGLGTRFLRHVERVRLLVHMLSINPAEQQPDPLADFHAIEREMVLHNSALQALPRCVVVNQVDRPEVRAAWPAVAAFCRLAHLPHFAISAATGEGTQALVNHLGEAVTRARVATPPLAWTA